MGNKTIKFKGIEFEEVSKKTYYSTSVKIPFIRMRIGKKMHYFLDKKRKPICLECGQVVKE